MSAGDVREHTSADDHGLDEWMCRTALPEPTEPPRAMSVEDLRRASIELQRRALLAEMALAESQRRVAELEEHLRITRDERDSERRTHDKLWSELVELRRAVGSK